MNYAISQLCLFFYIRKKKKFVGPPLIHQAWPLEFQFCGIHALGLWMWAPLSHSPPCQPQMRSFGSRICTFIVCPGSDLSWFFKTAFLEAPGVLGALVDLLTIRAAHSFGLYSPLLTPTLVTGNMHGINLGHRDVVQGKVILEGFSRIFKDVLRFWVAGVREQAGSKNWETCLCLASFNLHFVGEAVFWTAWYQ